MGTIKQMLEKAEQERESKVIWRSIALALAVLLALLLVSTARAQDKPVWQSSNRHCTISRPSMGFWAMSNTYDRDGCYTIRMNVYLDEGYCMNVSDQGSFMFKLENYRTGKIVMVKDCGLMFHDGTTMGWKENVIAPGPVTISPKDDGAMRMKFKQMMASSKQIPVRVLVYLPMYEIFGGGRSWDISLMGPLSGMTEVSKCGH